MTRDYAKQPKRTTPARNTRRQPSRKTLPGWLWMVAGILVGALIMAVISYRPTPAKEEIVEAVPEATEVEQDTNAPRPRFDFYTLLKESEVILNDDGTPQPAATASLPPPTLPPPSQSRDDADQKVGEQPSKQPAPVTPPAQPVTTTPPPSTATAQVPPAPAAETTAPPPAPQVSTTSSAPPSREVFLLQAGSFKSAADADNLRARLLLLNLRARVETVNLRPGETWHRVQVGPFDNTQSLATARNLLQQNGIASIQVKKTR